MRNFDFTSISHGPAVASTLAAILGLAGLTTVPALAADYDVGSMHITQAWARATPKGAASGAGYMSITNKGTAPDRVSCVSDDASAQCQIHSMTIEDGVMKMRPVEGGLEIKPGETVTLKPGGYHVMFVDLKHALVKGETVKATLKFDHAGTVDVAYPIAAIGAPAPGADAGGGTMMMQGGGMQGGGMQGPGGMNMQGGGMQGPGGMNMQGPSGGMPMNKP
jgi:periplasmic copper chaperone A